MSRAPSPKLLEDLLRPGVERAGLDLEEIAVAPIGRRSLLRVVVDKDGGVTLDDLAELTQVVSSELDHAEAMEDVPYTLEVTSPGTDRPLTLPRHWRRNVSRLVEITHADGPTLLGRIVDADETGAVLAVNGEPRRVDYAEVSRAKVQVEFTKPSRSSSPGEEG